jgi:uncharacterized protein (DUF302 family)
MRPRSPNTVRPTIIGLAIAPGRRALDENIAAKEGSMQRARPLKHSPATPRNPDERPIESTITKASAGSVTETVSRIVSLAGERSLSVFAIIDHSGEAKKYGLQLRDTKLVIPGSPRAGTPAMVAVPLVALDLPLRVLVWDDGNGTSISFTAPCALARRYGLSDELAEPLSGLNAFTDVVAASTQLPAL